MVLEAIPGSLRLITPGRLARNTYGIALPLLGIWLFASSAGLAALTGHYPFGFLPAKLLGPDDFAGNIAAIQTILVIGAMVAFKKPWRAWFTRFLVRHPETTTEVKIVSLRTGKLKNHPFDYCTLQVEAGVEEFHLAVREPLDRIEAAIHLAGQP